MKRFLKALAIILLPAFLSTGCGKVNQPNADTANNGNMQAAALQTQINLLPKEELSVFEVSSLMLMREEEKLARDVYTTLHVKWNATVFNNISSSEQAHMDALLMLLNKYSLTDPVGTNAVGVFSNTTLQNLYNQLLAQGNTGITDAYKAGATIEDLDIFDLKNALATIDNQDIRLVYESLAKGSRNHIRSFNKNILNVGGTYSAQFITQAEYDAIINSPMETGF